MRNKGHVCPHWCLAPRKHLLLLYIVLAAGKRSTAQRLSCLFAEGNMLVWIRAPAKRWGNPSFFLSQPHTVYVRDLQLHLKVKWAVCGSYYRMQYRSYTDNAMQMRDLEEKAIVFQFQNQYTNYEFPFQMVFTCKHVRMYESLTCISTFTSPSSFWCLFVVLLLRLCVWESRCVRLPRLSAIHVTCIIKYHYSIFSWTVTPFSLHTAVAYCWFFHTIFFRNNTIK